MPERLTLPGHQSGKSRLLLNAALVALFIWGGSMYKNQMGGNIAPPEVLDQVSRPSDKNAIRKVEFMSLLDRKRHFLRWRKMAITQLLRSIWTPVPYANDWNPASRLSSKNAKTPTSGACTFPKKAYNFLLPAPHRKKSSVRQMKPTL